MMVRSLWTGASGMQAQQFNIDTIAHDLSNINTHGYKRRQATFNDLLYQNLRASGLQAGDTNTPVGIQVGLGVKVSGSTPIMTVGSFTETGTWSDMAIAEEQANNVRTFFRVEMPPNGDYAYTRDGSFRVDQDGALVTTSGYYLSPQPGNIDPTAVSVTVTADGRIMQLLPGETEQQEIGQINLFTFMNPAGLTAIGGNLWVETEASGEAVQGEPGTDNVGRIESGFIEMSNVDAITEMVNMIAAQRAYEFNSRSIQTSDEMLQTINSLKR